MSQWDSMSLVTVTVERESPGSRGSKAASKREVLPWARVELGKGQLKKVFSGPILF